MFKVKDQNGKNKYSGRSRAKVLDNRDPLNKGRIIVDHPLTGQTTWIEYLRTPGHFTVPSIGDLVYIEADSGIIEYLIAWGNLTSGPDNSPNIPDEFRRDIPTNRGMFTPNGHLFEMDDGEATLSNNPTDKDFTEKGRGIRVTSIAGNKIHIAEDSEAGNQYILLEDVNGNKIRIDYKDDKITITSKELLMENDSTKIDSSTTSVTGTLDVDGDVTAKANLKVTGNSQLGGGTPLVLATAQFIATGNLGAPVISTIMSGQTTKVTSN